MYREPDESTEPIQSGPCAHCSAWIRLEVDGWSIGAGELWCGECARRELGDARSCGEQCERRGGYALSQLFERIRERQRLRAARRRQRRARERSGQRQATSPSAKR